jgi:hypothetical protein
MAIRILFIKTKSGEKLGDFFLPNSFVEAPPPNTPLLFDSVAN